MIRLGMVVEGETEEAFVQAILAPHLAGFGVLATAIPLRGGVSVDRLVTEMAHLTHSFNVVTTMVDFYGFQNRPEEAKTPNDLERLIDKALESRGVEIGDRAFSYVQMHEFEALLFAEVEAFAHLASASSTVVADLRSIRAGFGTPEDINNSKETSPSHRIKGVFPGYHKVRDGRAVAEEIGLRKIREECPRFDAWVSRIEALS